MISLSSSSSVCRSEVQVTAGGKTFGSLPRAPVCILSVVFAY